MSAATTAEPEILAKGNELACGEKNQAEHVRCARPDGHKGGHVSRDRKVYWPAEPAQEAS